LDSTDKRCFFRMFKVLNSFSYCVPQFLDSFYELSSPMQDAFISWFHSKIEDERWAVVANDRMMYHEFVKALLMHYSGSNLKNEPCFEDLEKLIAEFCRSDECKFAGLSKTIGMTFKEELEAL